MNKNKQYPIVALSIILIQLNIVSVWNANPSADNDVRKYINAPSILDVNDDGIKRGIALNINPTINTVNNIFIL